jgi:protein HOOK3
MKGVIESSLARIEDANDSLHASMEREEEDVGSTSDDDFEGGAEMSGIFRNAMQTIDSVTQGMDVTVASQSEFSNANSDQISGSGGGGNAHMDNVVRERDELRSALVEAKRELAVQKSRAGTAVEDAEVTQKKLRALATDLQERLEERQDELVETTEKCRLAQRALDDAEAKVSDLSEKNSSLADELDISNAKATQLKKAEATVLAYRRKLEGAGMMNQQMSELENQSAKYLGQIVDLEMEAKKIPELQKNLDDATREFKKVQKENIDFAEKVVAKTANIAKLKTELSASVTAKKMAEEELTELRSMQHLDQDDVDRDVNMTGLSLTSVQSVTDVREKVMRLEIENKTLQKQLDATVVASAPVPTNDTSMMVDDATVKALENEIEQLQAELKKKNAATAKLASDKDKLESYTKKTLSKFQEKYLVALQECKAKLKEKHDKIEALEMRSASEKSNQKKEERLLSTTIYELGLTLMQQKLKNGQ